MGRLQRTGGVVALAALLVAGATGLSGRHHAHPRVAILYGDSLAAMSGPSIRLPRGWRLRVRAVPEDPICAMPEELRTDLRAEPHPAVILIETVGDAPLACLGATAHLFAAYLAAIQRSLDEFFALASASGARVVFLEAPRTRLASLNTDIALVDDTARMVASTYPRVLVATTGHDFAAAVARAVTEAPSA